MVKNLTLGAVVDALPKVLCLTGAVVTFTLSFNSFRALIQESLVLGALGGASHFNLGFHADGFFFVSLGMYETQGNS